MLYSVQGIARSDDICVWSCPGKLEANFRTRILHLSATVVFPPPSHPSFFFTSTAFPFVTLRFPFRVPAGDESKSFQTASQALRLPRRWEVRRETAVSGLEFTGNNIVARRWPRGANVRATIRFPSSGGGGMSTTLRLRATFKLPKPIRSFLPWIRSDFSPLSPSTFLSLSLSLSQLYFCPSLCLVFLFFLSPFCFQPFVY